MTSIAIELFKSLSYNENVKDKQAQLNRRFIN